ncbi:ANTAR domain-containing response regulator [Clostridium sp. D2Q-11]|uniref:ANTAR domain-containing response regulator n=1 Tax=Anaeromonas frigoriresistens TaxID=2683708 RepID=A0A942USL7_9FIRM|nr:ANTAR domain-containing response regulator [Anaeromonas frigoriresistens]MBS4537838.1 ANTAR domain-containing response regulator [Anaeromonas frigoriresistens]
MRYRIVVADDDPITRMDISEILKEENYNVVGEASDGFDAVELCRKFKPDLVIMDVKMPILDGIKASKVITNEGLAKCIVVLTAYSGMEFIDQAKESGVMAYIVKPIGKKNLIPTIEVAISRGEELEKIKNDAKNIESQLEYRKIIEKAKGILMKKENISEEEAYNMIRKLSMDKRYPMKNIASAIIMNN